MKTAITTEKLRYRFSPEEHLKNAEHLAGKLHETGELKQNTDAIKADLAEQKKRLEAEIGRFARFVSDGFDMRDVQCRWDYGRPGSMQKTLVRLDTGDDVRTEMMLDHERQQVMNFNEPSHVLSGPGSLKEQRVRDLADSDIEYFASRDPEDLLKANWIQADVEAVFEEAVRRVKARGDEPKADNAPGVEETGSAAQSTGDSAAQFIHEVKSAPQMAHDSAGCAQCDSDVPLSENGKSHVDGSECPVAKRNFGLAAAQTEGTEDANTLSSAREVAGGTHARRPRTRRDSARPAPLTAEEREALEAVQAAEAEGMVAADLEAFSPDEFNRQIQMQDEAEDL